MIREKYIEERYSLWFCMTTCGTCISDSNRDHGTAKTPEDAEAIIKAHNETIAALVKMAQAWSESDEEGFKQYWYGRDTE